MTEAERFRRVRGIYLEAAALGAEERARLLDRACGEDRGLRGEVERLLRADTVATGAFVPPPEEAPPRSLGPYRVEREIGRGGMGAVFSAVDARGSRVALKVVHPHLSALPRLRERFLREAALGRLVEHENVVRTLGSGEEGARLFLVMEYVEGRTLRALMKDLGGVPDRLLREIALQAARGLRAIHEAGIVHRDVKPENLLITETSRVRLMDLGVARPPEAPSLTLPGQFLGSLHYAAPEQCQGADVGPPADLYSLGVVLYELAAGENPFARPSAGAILCAHLDHEPAPLEACCPDISPFLSAVVETLLAKEAARRFPSSAALAAVLEEAEASSWWQEREARGGMSRPRIEVRREGPLLGREEDLRALREAVEAMRGGSGGAILLEGEEGLGKTRLLDAFLRELPEGEFHLLYGSFAAGGGTRGLREAVLEGLGGARLEPALRAHLRRPTVVPAFAAFLRGGSEGPSLDPDALASAFTDLLAGLARERPLVLVLEDLEDASPEGRAIALALARAAPARRALVVLTAAPALPAADRALFLRGERAALLTPRRLVPAEVRSLLSALLPDEATAEAIAPAVAAKSDGIPLFVAEMARAVAAGGETAAREVPSTLREMVRARLQHLDPEERSLVDVAAVDGYRFEPDRIARATGSPLVKLLRRMAGIERRLGLVRGAGKALRFDNPVIREVLYSDLPAPLRMEYHTSLAEAEEARAKEPSGREAHYIALHHLRGGRTEAALARLQPALDFLRGRARHDEEIDLLREALAAPDLLLGPRRVEMLFRLADRLHFRRRTEEERAAAEEALRLAEASGDPALRARARIALGNLLWITDHPGAAAEFAEAFRLAGEAGDDRIRARALAHEGTALHRAGRLAEAQERFERALPIARAAGDAEVEGMAAGHLGAVYMTRGDLPRALPLLDRWREAARSSGVRRMESVACVNLSHVLRHMGRSGDSEEPARRALEIAEELGDGSTENAALNALGLLLVDLGRPAEARPLFERQAAGARRTRDARGEADALCDLALADWLLGRAGSAAASLDEADALARGTNWTSERGREARLRARLALDRGDRAGARAFALAAAARFEEAGEGGERISALALAADATEDPEEAIRLLREAAAEARRGDYHRALLESLPRLAEHDPAEVPAAAEALRLHGPAAPLHLRIEASWRLHRASSDPAWAAEARRLLREFDAASGCAPDSGPAILREIRASAAAAHPVEAPGPS